MRNLKTSIKALLAATIFALPSQLSAGELAAGNGPYGTFVSNVTGAKLVMKGYFDEGQQGMLRIIGASIVVQGESGGVLTAKEIEYTYDQIRDPGVGPVLLSLKPEGEGLGLFFVAFPSPSACTGGVNEPILAIGQEYNYHIQWCKNSQAVPITKKAAKKNYYYMFANGDYQLVLTLEYNCANTADKGAMPPPVVTGIPCP